MARALCLALCLALFSICKYTTTSSIYYMKYNVSQINYLCRYTTRSSAGFITAHLVVSNLLTRNRVIIFSSTIMGQQIRYQFFHISSTATLQEFVTVRVFSLQGIPEIGDMKMIDCYGEVVRQITIWHYELLFSISIHHTSVDTSVLKTNNSVFVFV